MGTYHIQYVILEIYPWWSIVSHIAETTLITIFSEGYKPNSFYNLALKSLNNVEHDQLDQLEICYASANSKKFWF